MAQTPQNRVHLFRLQILIIDGGLLVLRNVIDQTLNAQGLTLRTCLNQERSTISRLKTRGIITQEQYDLLFPTGGHVPTSSEMDLTLIIFLLRCLRCFGLNKNFDWKATPISTDVSIEADICRLKAYRNEISHKVQTTDIQANDFVTLWNDIEQILIRLSTRALNIQQTIADFKTCPLDPKEEKRVQEEIKKWKDYEADVDWLKDEMTDVKVRVTEVEGNQEEIKRRLDEEKNNKGFPSMLTEEEKYQKYKKELKGDLIKFYRSKCSSITLSPLFEEEEETPLAGFYVMPDIVALKPTFESDQYETTSPIKSLGDLFSTVSRDQLEIYLVACPGSGKTAFSKYLAIMWCQAHRPDKQYDGNKYFKDIELKALSKFEFLFLVFLRDHTSVSHIDDMIKQQFTLHLSSLKSVDEISSTAKLHEVLRREKCLIILDGLDEWTLPDNSCNEVTEEIPNRCVRDNCVILSTTRPWILGDSNFKPRQMDKKVQLQLLKPEAERQLEENAIRKMTGGELQSKRRDLDEVICDRGLQYMQEDPLLLMYIIRLWCDNKIPIGNSKHEIYTNIIEMLLSRTSEKNKKVRPIRDSSTREIPEYFKGHKFCKKFYSLITSLTELAYQTLFDRNRKNTLVFDRTVAEKYLKADDTKADDIKADDMKFAIYSGILSENRSTTLTEEPIKVSFSHQTVQQYFAAIFISFHTEGQKTVLEKCRSIQDILDMSIMFKFIIGMNADRMCAISNDLMSLINEDERTRDYRTKTGYEIFYYPPLYGIQTIFMSCLQEMPESENIHLCLQDFFIDEDTADSEQLQRLIKQNKTKIKSLYIDISGTSSSLCEIIDLFSLKDLSHIQKLTYRGDRKEAQISRILFPSLQNVYLLDCKWTNDEENLSENMARCQNLQYLYIEEFTFSHKILATFFKFISGQKSMKGLTMNSLYCKEHGRRDCERLNLDLSQHSTLSELDLRKLPDRLQLNISTPSLVDVSVVDVSLWTINLDESSLLLSRDMLNIEHVELHRLKMSAGSLQNFIIVLENLPQSVTVKLTDIKPEAEYESVKENIRSSQFFHVKNDFMWDTFEFKTIKPSKE